MKKRNLKLIATACTLSAVLMVGGIMAYFTDGDTATNTFTVGRVSIDLQEPNWDPDSVTEITPEAEYAKDPQVKNDGKNDLYTFIQVAVPYANVKTADEEGAVIEAADTQLFSWDVNDGWIQVGEKVDDTENHTYTYVYAYVGEDASAMQAVAEGVTTPAVFDYVRFANVIEDEGLEGVNLDIAVNSYAIQTDNLNDKDADIDGDNSDGVSSPEAVWAVVSTQAPSTSVSVTEDTVTDVKNV